MALISSVWFLDFYDSLTEPTTKIIPLQKTGSVQLCSDSFSTSLHKTSAHLELFLPYPAFFFHRIQFGIEYSCLLPVCVRMKILSLFTYVLE